MFREDGNVLHFSAPKGPSVRLSPALTLALPRDACVPRSHAGARPPCPPHAISAGGKGRISKLIAR